MFLLQVNADDDASESPQLPVQSITEGPRRLHVTNIPFRFVEDDLQKAFQVRFANSDFLSLLLSQS